MRKNALLGALASVSLLASAATPAQECDDAVLCEQEALAQCMLNHALGALASTVEISGCESERIWDLTVSVAADGQGVLNGELSATDTVTGDVFTLTGLLGTYTFSCEVNTGRVGGNFSRLNGQDIVLAAGTNRNIFSYPTREAFISLAGIFTNEGPYVESNLLNFATNEGTVWICPRGTSPRQCAEDALITVWDWEREMEDEGLEVSLENADKQCEVEAEYEVSSVDGGLTYFGVMKLEPELPDE